MEKEDRLHIIMLPWLALGHLIPFLELAKCIARKGHRVSFISTPKDIQRLPQIPQNLSPLINLVKFTLPHVDNLPDDAEATIDLPVSQVHYLKKSFDGLEGPVTSFLEDSAPINWIIYDFAPYWLPPIAARLEVPCAFFCLIYAAVVSIVGPPSLFLNTTLDTRKSLEDYLSTPEWIPFPSKVVYRLHEILRMADAVKENVAAVSESYRFGTSIQGSDAVFIRSCKEYELEWITLLEEKIFQKPVIPVGLLPPSAQERSDEKVEKWREISEWLDKQREGSVVYVSVGTEAELSQQDVTELAYGLELSKLPFFLVLRKPTGPSFTLPDGLEDQIGGQGFICMGWAPQVKILGHPSVGGFLTHCGWNSIIESLGLGLVLVLLPFLADRGLNARVLEDKKIGLEIERHDVDGLFTRESVAKSLRMVTVDAERELFRTNAGKMRKIFGEKNLHDQYIDNLVSYLNDFQGKRKQQTCGSYECKISNGV